MDRPRSLVEGGAGGRGRGPADRARRSCRSRPGPTCGWSPRARRVRRGPALPAPAGRRRRPYPAGRAAAPTQAAHARELAEVDRLRAALLAAVGHDLRTPLAGIKAAVSSLRDPTSTCRPATQAELLATVEESADRMVDLVENLLALSRLQAGRAERPPAAGRARRGGRRGAAALARPGRSSWTSPTTCRSRWPTPGCSNAWWPTWSPTPCRRPGRRHRSRVDRPRRRRPLRTAGHRPRPGCRRAPDRDRMFAPFQRLDDHGAAAGPGPGHRAGLHRGDERHPHRRPTPPAAA